MLDVSLVKKKTELWLVILTIHLTLSDDSEPPVPMNKNVNENL